MVQIYIPGNEQFQKNGDAVLFCYSCDLVANLNGTWELAIDCPIDDDGRWKLVTEEAVLKVDTWQDDKQLYRISKINKTDNGVSAIAYPIFYDSANDAMLMDCRPTNKNGQQALNIMCAGTPYSGQSNISSANTAYFVRRNLLSAINGNDDPTFISRWGGEILYDNYKVIINSRVGGDYGVEARYGRNINGVSYTVDTSTLVTRIIPVAYNGRMMSGDSPWVDSSHINSYAKIYTKEISYDHIRLAADVSNGDTEGMVICNNQTELNAALTAAAQADFATGIDTPNVSMEFDMAMIVDMASEYTDALEDSDGNQIQDSFGYDIESVWYRDYATLEKVRLGDTIHCRDSRLDITSTARVIALTWDCIGKRVTHVSLGDYEYNYVKEMSIMVNRVKNVLSDEGTVIAEQVKGFLDGSQTQLRTQYNLATQQDTLAILFENLDENSPMYGALGIGTQGISISKTRTSDGRDWEWTTGITANGMNASMGVFGILADKLGINYINLDTGEFSFGGSTTTIGGKTISQYMGEAHNELVAYEQSNDAVIADIQSQLDGSIESYFEDYTPTLNNYPASDWTTTALKQQHEGDLFYNMTDGNSYRFFQTNGVWGWSLITDTVATQALAIASTAKDTADGKRRTFVAQPIPPYDAGDVWYTGKEIKVCTYPRAEGEQWASSDWVRKDDYFAKDDFDEFFDDYETEIGSLQNQVDGKIETFSQSTDPSSGWTAAQKTAHTGDLWYNTSNGKTFRYTGSGWAETTATPPSSVVSVINKKAVIWTSEPEPPYSVGDLYFAGAGADILTCIYARPTGNFNSADWEKRNKYTDDSAINTFIQTTFADYMEQVQQQLDEKIETWYQNTDPSTAWTEKEIDVVLQNHTGADLLDSSGAQILTTWEKAKYEHVGDIWKNTTSNTEWVWNGGSWDPMDAPDELYDLIDGKSTVFTSSSTPSNPQNRDLWFRGPLYPIYTYVNGTWVEYNKYTSDENLDDFVDNTFTPWQTTTDNNVNTVMEKLDGQIIMAVCNGNIINAINMSTEGIAIQASKLNINGATSINNYFKVNTDGTFSAKKGDIGNIHVTADAIYSGNKTAYNSTYAGFFLGSDGKFGLGNSNTYIQWTGSALKMAVSELTIGGSTAATQSYAATQASNAQAAAISAAADDATTKANAAQSAAASDATAKANAAQSAAASDATAKANNAKSAAISTASGDATAKAEAAKEAAISAASSDATAKANAAAKTATNYLYYNSSQGLIVSANGSSYTSGYNARFKSDGIRFYSGNTLLSELTGTNLKFYYSGTQRMALNSSGLIFYEPDGTTTAATVTTYGLEVAYGLIAGLTINSNSISIGTLGADNSALFSSGTSASANIAGSGNISGWAFAAGASFGVTKSGALYANSGLIGNIHVASGKLYSGSKTAYNSNNQGFFLGSDGKFGVGDSSNYIRWDGSALNLLVSSLKIGSTNVATAISNAQSTANTANTAAGNAQSTANSASTAAATAQSTANDAASAASTAQSTANSASSAASAAQSTANSASSAASAAQSTASSAATAAINAAKTATDYLYYTSDGLIVSPNGSSYSSGYNTQITSGGIYFRSGTRNLASLTGSQLTFYRSSNNAAMVLTDSALTFYKNNGTSIAATINTNGLEVAAGIIGGFTTNSNSITYGTQGESNSFYLTPAGSSATIAGETQTQWALTLGANFGVTRAGSLYAGGGKIGGITISQGNLHTGNKTNYNSAFSGFCIEKNGNFGIGDGNNYLEFYTDGNGNAHVDMRVNSLKIGGTNAATTADTNAAAETATSYLHYDSTNGLVVSPNGSSYSSGYNTQIKSTGIYLRSGTRNLVSLTGDTLSFYRYANNAAMTLTSTALTFYKNNGTDVAATINANGLVVSAGKIGGFTTTSNTITYAASGKTQGETNTFFLTPTGSSATVAGQTITNWALTLGSNFGVTRGGALYCSSGRIAGWTVTTNGITSANDDAFIKIGDSKLQPYRGAMTVQTGLHVYADKDDLQDGNKQFKLFELSATSSGSYLRFTQDGATVAYSNSSSIRYKIVDRDMTESDVEQAYNIQPVMAKYKKGHLAENDERFGKIYPMFIAEDVEKYLPDAVDHNAEGLTETWNDRVIIPVMFQMIKDQKKEIEELKELIKRKGIA